MAKVLVTGGSGFIAAHCILQLLAAGHDVLWIPGYGRSAGARVTDQTRSVLRLKAVTSGA